MDYPSLIMKFTLLIQAGMTVRRAFQKISSDYLRNCPKEGRYAYEAVTTTCHEMDSGVAELEAYRRFGERCGQMKYKTFSTILIQNLQKGGHRMADLLEKAEKQLGEMTLCPVITGSGGLTLANHLEIPFVQEVIAVSTSLQKMAPQTDVAIELGGEDAKIIILKAVILNSE